jgi:hypothetical protein
MSLSNAPGEWRWEQRGLLWWRIHDELNITDGPYRRRWDWTAADEAALRAEVSPNDGSEPMTDEEWRPFADALGIDPLSPNDGSRP